MNRNNPWWAAWWTDSPRVISFLYKRKRAGPTTAPTWLSYHRAKYKSTFILIKILFSAFCTIDAELFYAISHLAIWSCRSYDIGTKKQYQEKVRLPVTENKLGQRHGKSKSSVYIDWSIKVTDSPNECFGSNSQGRVNPAESEVNQWC